jgi:hypothetical protein
MAEKIVSGAQTSADRALLDWAIFRDIPHSGLRFQSEVEGLPMERRRLGGIPFTVHEKKVEHRPGRGHRKSDTKSGTINARQGPSGAINPSRRPRKIARRGG